ncbi:MAG: hypothetical protein RIR96_1042 [Bacteroidota bacterium]
MFGIHETNVFPLHFFVLIQRNEAKKNQGKPDRSARFALPALVIKINYEYRIKLQTIKHQTPNN